ncbi:hypothetical protein V8C37DRAFT_368336 [Trichoderma ceciliae]
MVNSAASYTQDTNVNTEDGELTQDFFPPGSRHQPIDDENNIDSNDNSYPGYVNSHNDKKLIMSNFSERIEEANEIRVSNNRVVWRDLEDEERHAKSVNLYIYHNHTANKGLFKLYTDIYIKGGKGSKGGNRRTVYLYIRPEIVEAIMFENVNNIRSLHFSLTLKADLVIPKDPMECKPGSQPILDSIRALASVTKFTVHLNNSSSIPSAGLKKIASIYSPRPRLDTVRANLGGLYAGEGGQIGNANTAATSIWVQAEDPPPYHIPEPSRKVSEKRKRRSSDTHDKCPSTSHDNIPPQLRNFLEGMERRIIDVILDADGGPCRYGTEERNSVVVEAQTIAGENMDDLMCESRQIIDSLERDVSERLEQLDNEATEKIQELENQVGENTKKAVEEFLKEKLKDAEFTISLNI